MSLAKTWRGSDAFTDRELIEMTAFFVGIESGTYREGIGLEVDGDGPIELSNWSSFGLRKVWNPLKYATDQYAIYVEYVKRELPLDLPSAPVGVDPDVFRARQRCIDVADMVISELSNGDIWAKEWAPNSPYNADVECK
jgi:hypothetical protein